MQHRVRATGHAFRPHLTIRGMEQGQQFGRPVPNILVRLMVGLSLRSPATSLVGHSLKGSGLVRIPHRQTKRLSYLVSLLNQTFFAVASGSVISTTPSFRFRLTLPVSHQLASFCQLQPASRNTSQMV